MTEHTPLPWRDPGEHALTGYGDINHVIVGADGRDIGSLYANCFASGHMEDLPTVEQASANAALIVKAVNNHDALVKALKDIFEVGDGWGRHSAAKPAGTTGEGHAKCRELARAALNAVGSPKSQSNETPRD